MIKKILFLKTNNTFIQFLRYAIVGGIAFVVDFTFLYLFTNNLKIYYLVSAAMSFILGLVVSYFLSKTWVFNKASFSNKFVEFGVFTLIGIVGLFINEVFLWVFTDKANLHYLISKIFATIIVFLWNFFVRKFTLFK